MLFRKKRRRRGERAEQTYVVLVDDVALVVLEIAQAAEHDVAGAHPDLLAHLSADVAEARGAVEAVALAAAVAEHANHLGVLLPLLLELELPLRLLVLVLAAAAVLAALSLVLGPGGGLGA